MSAAKDLIQLLRDEQNALKKRDFVAIAGFAERKMELVDALAPPVEPADAALIERLAAENEKRLGIMRAAAQSVQIRMNAIRTRLRSVGYGDSGERLSLSDNSQSRRV